MSSQIRVAHLLSKQLNREVIIGSTSLDTPMQFLQVLGLLLGCCGGLVITGMHVSMVITGMRVLVVITCMHVLMLCVLLSFMLLMQKLRSLRH